MRRRPARWGNRSLGERQPFPLRQPSSFRSFPSPARRRAQRSRGRPPEPPSWAVRKAACQSLAFRQAGRSHLSDWCSLRLSYRLHSLVFILSSETVINSNQHCVPDFPRHTLQKRRSRTIHNFQRGLVLARINAPRSRLTSIWLAKVGGVRSPSDTPSVFLLVGVSCAATSALQPGLRRLKLLSFLRRSAMPTYARSRGRPPLWLVQRAGAQDFVRSKRAHACLPPPLPRNC